MQHIVDRLIRDFELWVEMANHLPDEAFMAELPLPSNCIGDQFWCLIGARESYIRAIEEGEWQGFTFPELDAVTPGTSTMREADKWNFRPPGASAESYAMLAGRVRRWLATLDRPTVCVTHGGIIRSLFHIVEGLSGEEAAMMSVPQDRLLVLEGNRLAWA